MRSFGVSRGICLALVATAAHAQAVSAGAKAIVAADQILVYPSMSASGPAKAALNRGESVSIGMVLFGDDVTWCAVSRAGETRRLGFASCEFLEPDRSAAPGALPTVPQTQSKPIAIREIPQPLITVREVPTPVAPVPPAPVNTAPPPQPLAAAVPVREPAPAPSSVREAQPPPPEPTPSTVAPRDPAPAPPEPSLVRAVAPPEPAHSTLVTREPAPEPPEPTPVRAVAPPESAPSTTATREPAPAPPEPPPVRTAAPPAPTPPTLTTRESAPEPTPEPTTSPEPAPPAREPAPLFALPSSPKLAIPAPEPPVSPAPTGESTLPPQPASNPVPRGPALAMVLPPTPLPTPPAPLASPPPPIASKQDDFLDFLLDASGLRSSLTSYTRSTHLIAFVDKGRLADLDAAALNRVLSEHFQPEAFYAAIGDQLGRNYSAERLPSLIEWLRSPVTRKLADLERNALLPDSRDDLVSFAAGLSKSPPEESRLLLIHRLYDSLKTCDMEVEATIALVHTVALSIGSALPKEKRYSLVELDRALGPVKSRYRSIIRNSRLVHYLFAYQSASDAELEQYVGFLESEDGKWFVSLVDKGFYGATEAISRGLSIEIPRKLKPRPR